MESINSGLATSDRALPEIVSDRIASRQTTHAVLRFQLGEITNVYTTAQNKQGRGWHRLWDNEQFNRVCR
jgi:hypothetical protein